MTARTQTVDEIEREIEEDRARLNGNLESLQDRFSLDSVVGQVLDQFRGQGGDVLNAISGTARRNPAAVALVGAGVAWMVLSNRGSDAVDSARQREDRRRARGDRQGVVDEHYPSWVARTYSDDFADTQSPEHDGGSSIADAAATAAEKASAVAENAKERFATARDKLAEGTDGMSEAARDRIVAARERALIARRSAARHVRKQADSARALHEQQPLVSGAIALAVGAAVGGLLPRTDAEDKAMGAKSDALIDDAERIFYEEREKLRRVAAATADEAKAVIRETKRDLDSGAPDGETAGGAVAGQAKAAAKRVTNAAKDAAKSEKLGEPNA